VEVAADDSAHGGKAGQQVGERRAVVLGQADLVEGAVAGAKRRVVHGDDRRRRRLGLELCLEPLQPLGSEPAAVGAGPSRVAGDQPQLSDVGRVLERVAG
jgi:hypothetical protein